MNHVNLYALSFSSSFLSLPFISPPIIDTSARPSPPEEQLSSQQKSESGEVEDGGGYEHETKARDSGGQEHVHISQRKCFSNSSPRRKEWANTESNQFTSMSFLVIRYFPFFMNLLLDCRFQEAYPSDYQWAITLFVYNYMQRSLEGYPGVTPFEGMTSRVTALVRYLPAGSPCIFYYVHCLVEKASSLCSEFPKEPN
ncbi:unnamed protein product [Lactuca saligna]|uniref:Uncharacterized protein n=1 Tax=Lactuca saligna TaxID=75948 RepID=A0AA35Z6E8_LACSI|nr:unnamed protein product [Lactuca saligna]